MGVVHIMYGYILCMDHLSYMWVVCVCVVSVSCELCVSSCVTHILRIGELIGNGER